MRKEKIIPTNKFTNDKKIVVKKKTRTNKNKEKDNFDKRFSFFYDFDGTSQLIGSKLNDALDIIFERITQDIFNDSLAKW